MHLYQAGLIIVTACLLELVTNWRTGFSLSYARRLVWFWESESLIQSQLTYVNVYTGSPFVKESSTRLGLLVYKCLHGLAPSYLSDMLALVSADPYSRRLRSAAHGDLSVPWTRTVRMGPRSFAVSGPKFWNSLAPELKHPNISLAFFKSRLKTELFARAYPLDPDK